MWWMLAAAALAGDLAIAVDDGMAVQVDGAEVEIAGGIALATGLVEGEHAVVVLDERRIALAERRLYVPPDRRLTYHYRNRGIHYIEAISLAALPVEQAAPVTAVIPRLDAPMEAASFERLLVEVDDATFSDDKLAVLRAAAASNRFVIDQVVALLTEFTHSTDRMAAVGVLAPAVLDPENAHLLAGSFTYSADRRRVLKYFETGGAP